MRRFTLCNTCPLPLASASRRLAWCTKKVGRNPNDKITFSSIWVDHDRLAVLRWLRSPPRKAKADGYCAHSQASDQFHGALSGELFRVSWEGRPRQWRAGAQQSNLSGHRERRRDTARNLLWSFEHANARFPG